MKFKKIISLTLTTVFLFLIGITLFWSIQIQNFKKNDFLHNEKLTFFKKSEFINLQKIIIKNSNSEFIFEKNQSQNNNWALTLPQKLEIDQNLLIELLSDTTSLTTIKILPQDEINKSNFALDNPTSQVTLIDTNNQSKILKVGILNTIDQTTYITLSDKKGIYHVEVNKLKFINLNLTDLNSQKIFSMDINQTAFFQINKKNSFTCSISNKNNIWKNQASLIIESLKIETFFKKLNDFKFQNKKMALNESKNEWNTEEKNLAFSISILNQSQIKNDYNIYGPFKESEENFYLIKINNDEIFYTNKNFIEFLTNYCLANFNI